MVQVLGSVYFCLLIATTNVGIIVANQNGLLVKFGDLTSFSVLMSLVGLAVIIGLEKMQVKGGILWVMIAITIAGLIWDQNVQFKGEIFRLPTFGEQSCF